MALGKAIRVSQQSPETARCFKYKVKPGSAQNESSVGPGSTAVRGGGGGGGKGGIGEAHIDTEIQKYKH